ncbi:sugar transferase [Mariniluteicoccus flavus]
MTTVAKRIFDVTAAAVGVALTSPLLVGAAVAVKLDSPGPVLFRQRRVGLAGQEFLIRKFRTMRHAAPGASITVGADNRITRVGAVLRKTKIDELPQLLDVVQGRMSLVGPRPEVPEYVALWPEPERTQILSVRPGITDPASIEFRHESEILGRRSDPDRYYREVILPQKVALYAEYARNPSLLEDIKIIFRTFEAIVR